MHHLKKILFYIFAPVIEVGQYSLEHSTSTTAFTLWHTVAFSCILALLTSYRYSSLPSPYQVLADS